MAESRAIGRQLGRQTARRGRSERKSEFWDRSELAVFKTAMSVADRPRERDALATMLARIAELRELERRHGRLTPVGRAMLELGERWLTLHAASTNPQEDNKQ